MAYEDRDVINNPSIYAEMVQKSGQSLSPCVEVNGHMLADVSGDEVEAYLLKVGVVPADRRLRRPTVLATRIRPTVLLAAKTYGKGVLNPLFSSVFARVRAENPIFSKTCRRCMA